MNSQPSWIMKGGIFVSTLIRCISWLVAYIRQHIYKWEWAYIHNSGSIDRNSGGEDKPIGLLSYHRWIKYVKKFVKRTQSILIGISPNWLDSTIHKHHFAMETLKKDHNVHTSRYYTWAPIITKRNFRMFAKLKGTPWIIFTANIYSDPLFTWRAQQMHECTIILMQM